MRYKSRLVAQGFSQRPGIDYMETYSLEVDAITFRYLINLEAHEKREMCIMDVITTYFYVLLNQEIFMKLFEAYKDSKDTCSIKLQNRCMD